MNNQTKQNVEKTIQRNWHDLKPGDVIRFANDWVEVFDAYPIAKNTVIVKIALRAPKSPMIIETHRIRVNTGNKAICQM